MLPLIVAVLPLSILSTHTALSADPSVTPDAIAAIAAAESAKIEALTRQVAEIPAAEEGERPSPELVGRMNSLLATAASTLSDYHRFWAIAYTLRNRGDFRRAMALGEALVDRLVTISRNRSADPEQTEGSLLLAAYITEQLFGNIEEAVAIVEGRDLESVPGSTELEAKLERYRAKREARAAAIRADEALRTRLASEEEVRAIEAELDGK